MFACCWQEIYYAMAHALKVSVMFARPFVDLGVAVRKAYEGGDATNYVVASCCTCFQHSHRRFNATSTYRNAVLLSCERVIRIERLLRYRKKK
jgi:hypothetical protein